MDLRGTYKGGGGPDKTVLNSAAQHDPKRVHVLVTYLRDPSDHEFQIPQIAKRLGINYVDVPDRRVLDWACLHRLKQILRSHAITVVHTHDDKTLLYGWLLKLTTPGLRIMHTCHSHTAYGRDDFAGLQRYIGFKARQRMQISLMGRYLTPIITVSQDTKNRLVQNGLKEKDVDVLHNGIDINLWQRNGARPVLREELALPPGNLLVGTVSRISHDKDLPTFYRVAEEVAKHHTHATFVVVGDGYGDELSRARTEVAQKGIEQLVRFTGHRNDLREVYASFDVFLMTSRTEGMPNALLEAMAIGIPVVSTRVGGVPELLEDGKEGFLAPVGDAEGLAAALMRFIRDPGLRAQFGAASRERIERRFSFSNRVRVMEDYYTWFAGLGPCPISRG